MTIATVDRLMHHATAFERNAENYRRRNAQANVRDTDNYESRPGISVTIAAEPFQLATTTGDNTSCGNRKCEPTTLRDLRRTQVLGQHGHNATVERRNLNRPCERPEAR